MQLDQSLMPLNMILSEFIIPHPPLLRTAGDPDYCIEPRRAMTPEGATVGWFSQFKVPATPVKEKGTEIPGSGGQGTDTTRY